MKEGSPFPIPKDLKVLVIRELTLKRAWDAMEKHVFRPRGYTAEQMKLMRKVYFMTFHDFCNTMLELVDLVDEEEAAEIMERLRNESEPVWKAFLQESYN